MKETIGNVILDYTFYPGKDLYSDGAVEDELLDIAREYEEEQWNQVIAERESWPILYHYSHIRQNIVSWLPISSGDRVLEIGSGCGAITGALADKAEHVTCVELSRKRSLINAYRHQKKGNIEILVGNFQDIEKTLGQYDVITLIGVFEYSNGYIGGEQPFVDMLRTIRRHLSPKGKLVIAIENRLGLKYWAGCTEDHTGTWFEGIEDYPGTDSVHTFSLKEIRDLVDTAGGMNCRMYYPYPDYKFPVQIFSDDRLPQQGELRELRYNFDRARLVLFDEIRSADSLIRNNLFPVFSNSFLLILTGEEAKEPEETCIYVKYSNERAEEFSTRTEIRKLASGEKTVRKLPESVQSTAFVKQMHQHYQSLTELYQNSPVRMNRCDKQTEGVSFEFCEGRTLEELLDDKLAKGEVRQAEELLLSMTEILRAAASEPFVLTDAFRTVFGEAAFGRELLCPVLANIDPICSNLIQKGSEWEMLDYEWSFSFPVPVDYQVFRMLHYYLYTSTSRQALAERQLFGKAGISEEERTVFEAMEKHFQSYIRGSRVPMRDMYDSISPGVLLDMKQIAALQRKADSRKIQIYADRGADFSEADSWHLNTENGYFKGKIALAESIRRLRIDPCEENCIVELIEYSFESGSETREIPVICTGRRIHEHTFYFGDEDPYFLLEVPKGQKQIRLEMKISYLGRGETHPAAQLLKERDALQNTLDGERAAAEEKERSSRGFQEQADRNKREIMELKKELAHLQEKIRQMEHTKVWKAYSRIKGNK